MKTPQRHIHRSYNYTNTDNDIQIQNVAFNGLSHDQVKISELPNAILLDGNDIIPFVDISGSELVTKKIGLADFMNSVCNISLAPSGNNIQFTFDNNTDSLYISTSPTGHYSSLLVNNNAVSVSGHQHSSSDINNFNTSVSGLLPADAPIDNVTYGRKNNTWVDITSPANLQIRRGTFSEVSGIIPLEGEPIWSTDRKILYLGDGSTYGGIQIGPKVPKIIQSFSQWSAVTVNIDPISPPDIVRISSTIPVDLGGITSTSGCYELLINNIGSYALTIKHEMSTIGGNPALIPLPQNRIITPNGQDVSVSGGYSAKFYYDTITTRWRLI